MKGNKIKYLSGDRQLYDGFKLGHIIGTGNAIVYQAQGKMGEIECVKEIRLEDAQSQFIFRKQVELLAKLKQNDHPNIVRCRGSYILQEQKNQFSVIKKGYIQMQKGITNLKTFLSHQKKNFSEQDIINFMKTMIDVFSHLQKIQIAHRDIKPSNILIFSQEPLICKVCDIGAGTAVGYADSAKQRTRTVIGTPYYLSPQLHKAFLDKMGNVKNNPYKSDVYSLGLVFIQVCLLQRYQGRFNSQPDKLEEVIQKIKKIYPNLIGLGKVIRRMLAYHVKQRLDFIELEKYIQQNDLLRSKLNFNATLDPEVSSQISTSCQVSLEGVQKLSQISNLISTGSNVLSMDINVSNKIMGISQNQSILFQQLKKIRHLDLEDLNVKIQICGIGDKQAKMLAQGIEKNKYLRKLRLNLWNNKITNQGMKAILKAVKTSLKDIVELQIKVPSNDVVFDSSFESYFDFSESQHLSHLSLNLNFNKIENEAFIIICKDIAKCSSLTCFELQMQKISVGHSHFKKAIKQFEKLQNIQELQINASCNNLRQEGMFALADFCASMIKLQRYSLLVRNAQVSDRGFAEFMKTIVYSVHLKELKLNFLTNQITEKGAKNVEEILERLVKLEIIDLNFSNNKLTDAGIRHLGKALIPLQKLEKVRLAFDSCSFGEQGCRYFGRLISELPNLSQFQLSIKYNQIKQKGMQYICAGLIKTKRLKKLKLIMQGTQIGDYSANYLAKCLLKIRTLSNVDLNLQNCNLSSETMSNILQIVKQYSGKAEQITIHMRKNKTINVDLYEKIKKQLNDSRIAIKIDKPDFELMSPLTPSFKKKNT